MDDPKINTASDLVRVMKEKGGNLSPGQIENREIAAEKLAHLFALKEDAHFQWFMRECVERAVTVAEKKLKSFETKDEDLGKARETYQKLRELKEWPARMEISCRRTINHDDPEISTLLKILDL